MSEIRVLPMPRPESEPQTPCLDASATKKPNGKVAVAGRFKLVRFDAIELSREPNYLVKDILPRRGVVVVWGPPKCGKSFWVFDIVMHVALGWTYRDRKVKAGPVVYVALEGGASFGARKEAFQQAKMPEDAESTNFWLIHTRLGLAPDHADLIASISAELGEIKPVAIVIDTLNRGIVGSENKDEDMGAFIGAAEAIGEAFDCAVVVVHHCGVDGTRPRGHTSLTGAVEAQIAVKRDTLGQIVATVEWLKDGQEGTVVTSKLDIVNVGLDTDGDPQTSCVIREGDSQQPLSGTPLTKNQQTMFTILKAAPNGLLIEEWNTKAREAGLGKRKADLFDFRAALQRKGLVYQGGHDRWLARQ